MKRQLYTNKPHQRVKIMLIVVTSIIFSIGIVFTILGEYTNSMGFSKFSRGKNETLSGPAIIGIGILVLIIGIYCLRDLKKGIK